MAQRMRVGGFCCSWRAISEFGLSTAALLQPEKQQTVPARAGDFARNGTQGTVMLRLVLKAIVEHFDLDLPAVVMAREQHSRLGHTAIQPSARGTSWRWRARLTR